MQEVTKSQVKMSRYCSSCCFLQEEYKLLNCKEVIISIKLRGNEDTC